MSGYEELKEAVQKHGEVHVEMEEIAEEVELRRGPTEFDDESKRFAVEGPDTTHYFDFGHVVSWYRPYQVFHQ